MAILRATGRALQVPVGDAQSPVLGNMPVGSLVVDDSGTLFVKSAAGFKAVAPGVLNIPFQFTGTETSVTKGYLVTQPSVLPATLTGSQAKGTAGPSANTTFTLNKNGSSIGSVVFAITTGAVSYTFAADVSLAAGDLVTLVSPAALNSIGITYFNFSAALL